MKKILECVVFCAVGLGIMALLYKLVRMIWGDFAAGAAYLSFIIGLFSLFKVVANYQWGQRLGRAEKLDIRGVFQTLNTTLILVYVVCLLVGSDSLLGMVVHDFTKLPSAAGFVLLYCPILIGYYLQQKKLARPNVQTEGEIQGISGVDSVSVSPVLVVLTAETKSPGMSKQAAKPPRVKVKHLIMGLVMTSVAYVVQAYEPSLVNKCGFYFFLIATLLHVVFFAKQRKQSTKKQ